MTTQLDLNSQFIQCDYFQILGFALEANTMVFAMVHFTFLCQEDAFVLWKKIVTLPME